MATRIFDRETLLDLVVNGVPLFILLFFTVGFLVFNPFGFDPLASGLQFALVVVPFVLLALLTYFSARAIAGDERTQPVFLPGQTTPPEAEPVSHGTEADDPAAAGTDAAASTGSLLDEDAARDPNEAAEPAEAAETAGSEPPARDGTDGE
jgi:hypothetical protein